MKLEKALQDISGLESTIEKNTKEYNSEYNRLNTEIERLNNILKATNGNMQEQITKLSDQIKKLQKEIMDLKTNLQRVENEKQEEIGKAEKARISYEARIKDLES